MRQIRIDECLRPYKLMVFYKRTSEHYVEEADVSEGKVKAYRPLSKETLRDLFSFAKYSSESYYRYPGILPNNVKWINFVPEDPGIAWVVPGARRTFNYLSRKLELTYPSLIFKWDLRGLMVFATKEIPEEVHWHTKLYKAPLPNIFGDHRLCFGTMNRRDFHHFDLELVVASHNDMFFESPFSTEMSGERTKKTPMKELLTSLSKKMQPFPEKELVSAGMAFKDILQ